MSDTTTVPGSITVLSGETLPISIDMTLLVNTGETPSTPTSALFDITSTSPGTSFPTGLSGAPTIAGNVVTQKVTGLTAGHTYRLVLGFTAVAGKIWQAGVIITCPF